MDQVYYGGFQDWRQSKRARIISSDQDIGIRAYGNAGDHWQPNTATVLKFVNAWLDGADGFLTWQTIGNNRSLDVQESCQGNALFVPGDRFGLPVVGDLRIKAIRNAEQFIEYLVMLQKKFGYSRPQIKSTLMNVLSLDPDEKQIRGLNNEQLYKLRRLIVELIADS
nr:hypothetical protein [uncultured Desulfobacter sp.]